MSHDIVDARSKSFDMLRTQVLQSMDLKSWQLLAVTSPTAACGKTTISVNLALSIARQPHRSVLLVDMDPAKAGNSPTRSASNVIAAFSPSSKVKQVCMMC